jgi:hypothetical protein
VRPEGLGQFKKSTSSGLEPSLISNTINLVEATKVSKDILVIGHGSP